MAAPSRRCWVMFWVCGSSCFHKQPQSPAQMLGCRVLPQLSPDSHRIFCLRKLVSATPDLSARVKNIHLGWRAASVNLCLPLYVCVCVCTLYALPCSPLLCHPCNALRRASSGKASSSLMMMMMMMIPADIYSGIIFYEALRIWQRGEDDGEM